MRGSLHEQEHTEAENQPAAPVKPRTCGLADRFANPPETNGNRDDPKRHDCQKYESPSELRRDESTDHRSDAQPGVGTGRDNPDFAAAPLFRIGCGDHRERTAQHHRRSCPLQEAQHHDHIDVGRKAERDGDGREKNQPGQHHPALPDEIPKAAEGQHAHCHGEHEQLLDQAELHGGCAQVVAH